MEFEHKASGSGTPDPAIGMVKAKGAVNPGNQANQAIRLVFMGTPEFAAHALEVLAANFQVTLAVTQTDKPKGRGKTMQGTPVKITAEKLGIPCITPAVLKTDEEAIRKITDEQPDFIVVVAFGQILTQRILQIPKYGCINLHASLLPKLRGAAPIQAAIMQGFTETGNTTMLMAEGLDTGDMLLTNKVEISAEMTYGGLHDALMETGAALLVETIHGVYAGVVEPIPQDEGAATYVPKMNKQDAMIDFNESTRQILNKIRGLNPIPLASTCHGGRLIKIVQAQAAQIDGPKEPGRILKIDKTGIVVGTGDGAIRIRQLQLPGKKTMEVRDFLNGNTLDTNLLFTRSE